MKGAQHGVFQKPGTQFLALPLLVYREAR